MDRTYDPVVEVGMALRWRPAHAYTPNEAPLYGGGTHATLLEAFEQGRFRRAAYDALCKPSRKFWGLHDVEASRPVTCKRCKALLERFNAGPAETPPAPIPAPAAAEPQASAPRDPNLTLFEALACIFKG